MKWLPNKNDADGLQQSFDSSEQIDAYIKDVQRKLANRLQFKTERLSVTKKKISLLLFSILFGGCSIAVMVYSFLVVSSPIVNSSITFPKYTLKYERKLKPADTLISHHEYVRINQCKRYLKYLQKDSAGGKTYDSLMQARPHLLDSINLADSLFTAQ